MNVLGWISELAFAPVDLNVEAMQDEWSTDFGVGCKYFSQDAVIKLAPRAGIELDPALSHAEKLKVVQKLMEADDPRAQAVFTDIGIYLAYAVVKQEINYILNQLANYKYSPEEYKKRVTERRGWEYKADDFT